MQKRGQISIFLMLGIVILIIGGLFFYLSTSSANKKSEINIAETGATNADIVKAYAESCVKMISEDALFNRIGLQGGYISPSGDAEYKEEGAPMQSQPSASYQNNAVPYYLNGNNVYTPVLNDIKNKLANYIIVEFEKCFNAKIFEDIGINIIKPSADIIVDASLNEEDVSVTLDYPLTIKIEKTETKLDSFGIVLPIRVKALYDSAVAMANRIKTAQPNAYDMSFDCGIYDKNKLTNVYLKNSNDGKAKIIQLVDFSTYQEKYFNSYIFQFAVRNVAIEGSCVG